MIQRKVENMLEHKHAYLIIAHNQFDILEKLLLLLDDYRNDIYLHIDKKVKDFSFEYFQSIVSKSTIYFVDRMSVNWGGFSQVKCEMLLLETAIKKNYYYYHLLSGVDLPLKSQDNIHNFFRDNPFEFVHFDNSVFDAQKYIGRVRYYHPLQEILKKPKSKIFKIVLSLLNRGFIYLQKKIKVDRQKNDPTSFQKGANWFSITNDLANYVVSQKKWINETFSSTSCSDELFLQTVIINSSFVGNLYRKQFDDNYLSCMRKIDWNRGSPFIWTKNEYDELVNSEFLFARKFDYNVDKDIIEMIFNKLTKTY